MGGGPNRVVQRGRLGTPSAHVQRRLRRLYRRRGWRELALLAGIYVLYDVSRLLVAGQKGTALIRGASLLHLEQTLNVAWEQTVNQFVSANVVLGVTADYAYAALHYIVTPLVLLWMWRRHRAAYRKARTVLALTTLAGLAMFAAVPVAPPRMLPGFVDTMARFSGVGWWGADASAPRGFGGLTNQFAAMPSLHVAWALWCGWQLVQHGRHVVVRFLGVLYPLFVVIVVIATGNHYLLDAVAGLIVVLLAMGAIGATGRMRSWSVRRLTHDPDGGRLDGGLVKQNQVCGGPERNEAVSARHTGHRAGVAAINERGNHSFRNATGSPGLVDDKHSAGRQRLPQQVVGRQRRQPAKIEDPATDPRGREPFRDAQAHAQPVAKSDDGEVRAGAVGPSAADGYMVLSGWVIG